MTQIAQSDQNFAGGKVSLSERPVLEVQPDARALIFLINELAEVAQQETELVRIGRLGDAAQLTEHKSALAGRYLAAMVRMRAIGRVGGITSPDLRALLAQRNEALRSLLEVNLTVLATAHAVAEGLVRGATTEAARQASPQTYGACGYATAPSKAAQPVALSRAS